MGAKKAANFILEMDFPSISCGNCHFTSSIAGKFAVEDGRLVFRADPDPQPRRGPHFSHCGECGTAFSSVRWEWGRNELPGDDWSAILDTARKAKEQEWADWQEEYG